MIQNRVRTCNKHQSVPKKSGLWYSSSELRFGFLIIWTPSYYGYDVWIYVLFDKTVFACILGHFPDKCDWDTSIENVYLISALLKQNWTKMKDKKKKKSN